MVNRPIFRLGSKKQTVDQTMDPPSIHRPMLMADSGLEVDGSQDMTSKQESHSSSKG